MVLGREGQFLTSLVLTPGLGLGLDPVFDLALIFVLGFALALL